MLSSFNHTQNKTRQLAFAVVGGIVALSASAFAGDAGKQTKIVESSVWEKPAWLTDLAVRVGESYDSNVYAVDNFQAPGDHIATANKGSWVTTISPKIGVDFAKLLASDSIIKTFTLGYAPDIVLFHNAPDESYSLHRVTTGIKAKADNVTLTLDNAFTYINGDQDTLKYTAASAYANGVVRERREQWQERTKAAVKIDVGNFFVRPNATLLYYDLDTTFRPGGFSNYVDRYDLNGGVDLGYNVTKNTAFFLGYRYGHQEQASLPDSVASTSATGYTKGINVSSDYQRVLLGVEGSPTKWLKVEAAVGPQFTSYTNDRPYNNGVVANGKINKNPEDIYAEASVTITPTKADAFVLKYKRWDWVSSTGVNAYRDSLYDASYRRQLTKKLQLELGLRASNSNYNPSSARNDTLYTVSTGLKYAVNKNLGLDLSYSYDKGANDQTGTGGNSNREFERSIVSTGVSWKF